MNNLDTIFQEFISEHTPKEISYDNIKNTTWIDDFGDIVLEEKIKEQEDGLFDYGDLDNSKLILKTNIECRGNRYLYSYKGYDYVSLPYLKEKDYTKQEQAWLSKECIRVLVHLNNSKKDSYITNVFDTMINSKFYDKYTKPQILGMISSIRNKSEKPIMRKKKVVINHDFHMENDQQYNLLYSIKDWKGFIVYKRGLYMKYLGEGNSDIIKKYFNEISTENKYKKITIKNIKEGLENKGYNFSQETIRKRVNLKSTKELIELCLSNGITELKEISNKLGVSVKTIRNNM